MLSEFKVCPFSSYRWWACRNLQSRLSCYSPTRASEAWGSGELWHHS